MDGGDSQHRRGSSVKLESPPELEPIDVSQPSLGSSISVSIPGHYTINTPVHQHPQASTETVRFTIRVQLGLHSFQLKVITFPSHHWQHR